MTDTATATTDPAPTPRMRSTAGRVTVIVVVLTVVLVLFGIWWVAVSMPTTASNTMKAVRDTMLVFSIAAAPVMAVVWGIAYFSLRHWSRGAGEEPPEDGPPIRGNNRLVLSWVLISSVLTLFLLVWGLAELTATSASASGTSPLVVEVTGQQWVWSFKYPGQGDVSSADLVLPADRPVVFKVTSTDVIHSFWLPEMGIKVDANPGVVTETNTTPTRIGTFNVRCAELCGLNHAFMQTTVDVVSPTDFDAWVQSNGGTP
jgi:cytochrome c oxidase subunit 2